MKGLEIENHLKKKVRDLEKKKVRAFLFFVFLSLYLILLHCMQLVSDKMLRNGISGLRQHHSLHRLQIMDVLEEERCYLNSLISMVNFKIKQITETREMAIQSSVRSVMESAKSDSSDEIEPKIGAVQNSVSEVRDQNYGCIM